VRHAGVRLRRERWANGETPWIGYVHLPLHAMGLPTGWTGPAKRLLLHLRVRRGIVWRTGACLSCSARAGVSFADRLGERS
jgi:hypothetical protein